MEDPGKELALLILEFVGKALERQVTRRRPVTLAVEVETEVAERAASLLRDFGRDASFETVEDAGSLPGGEGIVVRVSGHGKSVLQVWYGD